MKRILVTIEDRHLPLLEKSGNKSKLVRDALDLLQSDIPASVVSDIRNNLKGTVTNHKLLKDIDSKLDYIAGKL